MSQTELDRLQDAFLKADALAQQGDRQAAEDARLFAQEIRRIQSAGGRERGQMMRQVNRGIVDAAGGLVDLINPFDQPHALNPFPNGTGSAREGLRSGMQAAGIEVAEGDPENTWQAMQRGAGEAAAIAPVAGQVVNAMRAAPGMIGRVAQTVAPSMTARSAPAAEAAGGALSSGAADAVERRGGPSWLQNTAAVLAPGAVGAIAAAPQVAANLPAVRAAMRMLAPFTERGARDVARQRLQSLAGGTERAAELAARVDQENPLGLTPAQMTEDPNMMGLERLAIEQDPNLRERLVARDRAAQEAATAEFERFGNPAEARRFLAERRQSHVRDLRAAANRARADAMRAAREAAPRMTEAEASTRTFDAVTQSLDAARATEEQIWQAIPESQIYTANRSRMVAEDMIAKATQPWMQEAIPPMARPYVENSDSYTFAEMHAMYSSLRQLARNDRAGTQVNRRRARNADLIADAILDDMDAMGVEGGNRAVVEALAYSRALHETFDQGALGRILQKTVDADTQIDPTLSLRRTVGRGGQEGATSAQQIVARGPAGMPDAAPQAEPFVQDFVRRMFTERAMSPMSQDEAIFDRRAAARFVAENRALLDTFPQLRDTITSAARRNERLQDVEQAIANAISQPRSRQAAVESFISLPVERAVASVYNADNPVRAARSLLAEARRDPSGEALAGLKGAFASELILRGGTDGVISGRQITSFLNDPRNARVLRVIFSDDEMGRFRRIAAMAQRAQTQPADVGPSLSGSATSMMVETLARVTGANVGAQVGGGSMAASIQTANIGSSRAVDIVRRLTSDKAAQLIADSIEDPQLFRALLMEPRSPRFDREAMPRLLPYLVGGATAAAVE